MSDKEITENEEEEDQIIELVDDDGKVIKFRLLDVTEYKGKKYTLLLIAEPANGEGGVVRSIKG